VHEVCKLVHDLVKFQDWPQKLLKIQRFITTLNDKHEIIEHFQDKALDKFPSKFQYK